MRSAPVVVMLLLGAAILWAQRATAAASKSFLTVASKNPTVMSHAGIAFLKRREGFSATAYPDGRDASGKQLYSIAYGHQIVPGDGLSPSSVVTEKQGSDIFLRDLASREKLIRDSVRVPITQPMFDALVSLAYNIGNSAFLKSTLLKKLNAKDYAAAAREFMAWTKSGTQNVERRKQEAAIFSGGSYA